MATWEQLESRFKELEGAFHFARLDGQSGSQGEYWRVAGSVDRVSSLKFQSTAALAGRKLVTQFGPEGLPEELSSAPDDKTRWYRALKDVPGAYQSGMIAYPANEAGEKTGGCILSGSISNPAAVSAAHCLQVMSLVPEEDEQPPAASAAPLHIHVNGQQNRVNVHSVDRSTNTIASGRSVFEGARRTIKEEVPVSAQARILAKLDELEEAVKTPAYTARYREFVQVVGEHVTVLAPLVAGLAALLG